jgi:hypothetical protein
MGKFRGIGGGFLRGCLVALCVGIIIAILSYLVVISIKKRVALNNPGEDDYSRTWIVLLGLLLTTYFMGSSAVLYYGMSYPYEHGHEVGLEECKKNIPE